ncbi:uncharacterized protein METZ01_LOCUS400793 [marine metagenome]|uniref:Uncharacterized protein n=1 Tax=marine metagenome TaxID=408172 RepID=A0A382VN01_9ZZZZ
MTESRVVAAGYQDMLESEKEWTVPSIADFNAHDFHANRHHYNYGGASSKAFCKDRPHKRKPVGRLQ